MTERTAYRSPLKIGQAILKEWCASNGIVLEPLIAADLVSRIETEIEDVLRRCGPAEPKP